MEDDELELRIAQSDASRLQRAGLAALLVASVAVCVVAWLIR